MKFLDILGGALAGAGDLLGTSSPTAEALGLSVDPRNPGEAVVGRKKKDRLPNRRTPHMGAAASELLSNSGNQF